MSGLTISEAALPAARRSACILLTDVFLHSFWDVRSDRRLLVPYEHGRCFHPMDATVKGNAGAMWAFLPACATMHTIARPCQLPSMLVPMATDRPFLRAAGHEGHLSLLQRARHRLRGSRVRPPNPTHNSSSVCQLDAASLRSRLPQRETALRSCKRRMPGVRHHLAAYEYSSWEQDCFCDGLPSAHRCAFCSPTARLALPAPQGGCEVDGAAGGCQPRGRHAKRNAQVRGPARADRAPPAWRPPRR